MSKIILTKNKSKISSKWLGQVGCVVKYFKSLEKRNRSGIGRRVRKRVVKMAGERALLSSLSVRVRNVLWMTRRDWHDLSSAVVLCSNKCRDEHLYYCLPFVRTQHYFWFLLSFILAPRYLLPCIALLLILLDKPRRFILDSRSTVILFNVTPHMCFGKPDTFNVSSRTNSNNSFMNDHSLDCNAMSIGDKLLGAKRNGIH